MKPIQALVCIVSAAGLLALAGCNNLGSPRGTVESAYSDIQKGDLSGFQSTLSGSAQIQFGTEAGMGTLQKRLAGQNPEITRVSQTSSSANPDASGWTEVYDVIVSGKSGAELLYLTVVCDTTPTNGNPSCLGGNPLNDPACPPPGMDTYSSLCTIDSIALI